MEHPLPAAKTANIGTFEITGEQGPATVHGRRRTEGTEIVSRADAGVWPRTPQGELGNRRSVLLSYGGTNKATMRRLTEGLTSTEGQNIQYLVEIGGFEPPTSAMRTQRSPN